MEFAGLSKKPDLFAWEKIVAAQTSKPEKKVRVGLVAKYMDNEDTYISIVEALKSAAWEAGLGLDVKWINAEEVSDEEFANVDALLVPGGFGSRGVDGKIAAARYALEHNVPYLGICLGLQVAVIAAARRGGLEGANSSEFGDTKHDVVYIMEGQSGKESTGGTLRLGDYPATLTKDSKVASIYGSTGVVERHRHRYEVNQKFIREVEKGGLIVSGTSPDGKLVEFVESPVNTFFVATQAHPEFKSRPYRAHPLFAGLIRSIDK
jgi:CTP synthase